ncbi:MAG: hypothetical protein ACREF4_08190, partial [Gammaproteobacteria bacterium]
MTGDNAMPMVSVPPAAIEAELARYFTDPRDDPPEAQAGAVRHRVLPLLNDFVGCWALTVGGQLVFFAWDAPERLDVVSDLPADALGTHVAFAIGSRRYSTLSALGPTRT